MDYIIIVAGGKGLRMGGDLPKQFMLLKGQPILMHTIMRFHEYDPGLKIILVLPKDQQDYWHELCKKYRFTIPHTIADGGETRFHSTLSGLSLIPNDTRGLVGVHDGVRPFPSVERIRECYNAAAGKGAVIPVIPVVDTLRHISGRTVDRSDYMAVQTPQVFTIDLLKKAFQQPYSPHFTDDASVVEAYGHTVSTVEGCRENIKITTPYDLKISEAIVG